MFSVRTFAGALLTLALTLPAGHGVQAQDEDQAPPLVARISLINGDVAVKRGDSDDTVAAAVNAPVNVGDYLSTGDDSRAEIEIDFAESVRLAADVQARFVRLDPDNRVMQLAAGTIEVSQRRGDARLEIDTPSVSVTPDQPGRFRVTVTPDGQTFVTVRSGEVQVAGGQNTQALDEGQTLAAQGPSDNPSISFLAPVPRDGFDAFAASRDREILASQSFHYANVYGAEDLDNNGSWETVGSYGNVWIPNEPAGWAPYHDGRWVWEPYYGWTWVAAEPWGWAPYHYGRWFYAGDRWCWYPGPVVVHPVWQPALVAFVGFTVGAVHIGLGIGNVGWVPLAPAESYHPWYGGYRGGTTIVNNTTIVERNVTVINNTYNVTNLQNYHVHGAVVAVSTENFTAGRFEHPVVVEREQLAGAVAFRGVVPVVPSQDNLRLSARGTALAAGSTSAFAAHASFRTTLPAARVQPFATQQRLVQETSVKTYPGVKPFVPVASSGAPLRAPLAATPAQTRGLATEEDVRSFEQRHPSDPVTGARGETPQHTGAETAPLPRTGSETAPPPRAGSETAPPPRAGSETAPLPRTGSETAPLPRTGSEPGTTPRTGSEGETVPRAAATAPSYARPAPEGATRPDPFERFGQPAHTAPYAAPAARTPVPAADGYRRPASTTPYGSNPNVYTRTPAPYRPSGGYGGNGNGNGNGNGYQPYRAPRPAPPRPPAPAGTHPVPPPRPEGGATRHTPEPR